MKKLLSTAFILGLSLSAFAQGEMDVYKMSRNDLTGTARSVSMGGAFGALGGDLGGIAVNPAGIGVFTRSEVATTVNFNNTKSKTDYVGNGLNDNKFRVQLDNIGGVFALPLQSDEVPFLNFGFTYNRIKNFNRKVAASSGNTAMGSSLADYMAVRASADQRYAPGDLMLSDDYYPFRDADWLPSFGFSSNLIQHAGNNMYQVNRDLANSYSNQDLYYEEKGGIHSYDINVGTTISNMFSVGLTVGITDIDYKLASTYHELMEDGGSVGNFDIFNRMKTEGTGWQVKLGTIFKPIEELRIGVAYHSPTWYDMTDYYYADMGYNMKGIISPSNQNRVGNATAPLQDELRTEVHRTDYEIRTPDKFVFSLAGVIGRMAILSVDYELTNYRNMRVYDDGGHTLKAEESFIKADFKKASTVRVGAEVRVTPQFSLRAGYAWMQNPLEKSFKNNDREVMTTGSVAHYTLEGDRHNYTFGLGYRFTPSFYVDAAFVMMTQKDSMYPYARVIDYDGTPMYDVEKISLKTEKFQGMLTLGYRF